MKPERLDDIFIALSHPTRRAMLKRLLRGSASVTELGTLSPISLNSASKHVRILERAGFVDRDVGNGPMHVLSVRPESFDDAVRWISKHRPQKKPTRKRRRKA